MINICEIFYSIQGESSYSGWPTTFIRTSGCNLRCKYCDSTYAYKSGKELTLSQIINLVKKNKTQYVCITGGEPLLQKNVFQLANDLCALGYIVSIETNGSILAKGLDARVKKIFDVKTPDSGAANSFNLENLKFANFHDEFKFVLNSHNDFEWSEKFIKKFNLSKKFLVLYSPSFKKISEKWLAKNILLKKSSARFQLQTHKIIWGPRKRGV